MQQVTVQAMLDEQILEEGSYAGGWLSGNALISWVVFCLIGCGLRMSAEEIRSLLVHQAKPHRLFAFSSTNTIPETGSPIL
jgi:hypothetical protein